MTAELATARLTLRRPTADDVDAILAYASDAEVTRYLGWPRHTSAADTRAFLVFADAAWRDDGVGPYLLVLRETGAVIGSTGLARRAGDVAETGYVLARASWGRGLATEAVQAMVALAATLGIRTVVAHVHPAHAASMRVLAKCGFTRAAAPIALAFPNLAPVPQAAVVFTR